MARNVKASDSSLGTELAFTEAMMEAMPQEVAEFLSGAQVESESAEAATRSIVTQTLMLGTAEEIFGETTVSHKEDVEDKPITITAVKWHKSRYVDEQSGGLKLSFFAALDYVDANHKHGVLVTGCVGPMAQIYRAAQLGILSDQRVKFVRKETPTANGFYPWTIRLAD